MIHESLKYVTGTLSLSQSEEADYGQSLALPHLNFFHVYTPVANLDGSLKSNTIVRIVGIHQK